MRNSFPSGRGATRARYQLASAVGKIAKKKGAVRSRLGHVISPQYSSSQGNTTGTSIYATYGLYVLDGGDAGRDNNIRSDSFITGYANRWSWSDLETAEGVYDFNPIFNVLDQLPTGQLYSLLLVPPDEPPYLLLEPGILPTWNDGTTERLVPWDPILQTAWLNFITALGDAVYPAAGVALKNYPPFVRVQYGCPGWGIFRDFPTLDVTMMTGYTRTDFVGAIQQSFLAAKTALPNQLHGTGLWTIEDATATPELTDVIGDWLVSESYFLSQDNAAASRPAPGTDPVTLRPNYTGIAAPLYARASSTDIGFQMLDAQISHQPGHAPQMDNGTIRDAVEGNFGIFGARYWEIYIADIDWSAWDLDMAYLRTLLQTP